MKMQSSLLPQLQQKMKLSPQIIQSIEILQLPLLALIEHVQQELVDNPVLEEVVEDRKDEMLKEGEDITLSSDNNTDDVKKDEFDRLGEIAEDWRDYYSQTIVRRNKFSEERDQKQEALENTAAKPMSLHDYLMGQASLVDIPDHLVEACENIIYSIDKAGYLASPLEEIMQSLEKPLAPEEIKEALKIVQSLEPPGVGARNLQECLLLQLDKRDPNYSFTKELLLNHLEDIEMKKYPLISKKTGQSLEAIKKQVEFIRTLNPKPGSVFCDETIPYVVPEIKVEYLDGKYEVFLIDNTNLPHLHISSFYKKFLNKNGTDNSTLQYIQKKIESAKWLIEAIEQRRSTLYKVACKIVELQEDFLNEGIQKLRTLKMQDVADVVGVHVSTVSRAIAHKYIQTPQGIFEIKFFFTGGFQNVDGSMESWEAIRQKLSEIIAKEDKSNPLSDEEIAEKLHASGVAIARRTVTKYRRIMKIPSSRQRKVY
ncbi:MAG: RNA polymerase factor sigma-54 [Candidatus Loosdrechtia sp.]|uniref:RNA polymerase factor sigma-54 n=1 Tax=Candidatus Loosdrechtia sp. TaxID=3101272 RepID=UPI003A6E1A7A|nr:MAG: RNA polymerase factor sigma-54 [Candidatus Jettenia sp. AMX2]